MEAVHGEEASTIETHIFLGGKDGYGITALSPKLLEYVSEKLKAEAAVSKERRKAREERALAAKK